MQEIDFGYVITVRRVMLRMSRREACEAAGLSYPYWCELENGTKSPSWGSLSAIVTALRFARLSDFVLWGENATAIENGLPPK